MLLTQSQVDAFGGCHERVVKAFNHASDNYTVELLDLSHDDGRILFFEVSVIDQFASRGAKRIRAAFDSFYDAVAYFDAIKDMERLPEAPGVIPNT
ncbi:hypothetical protein RFC57_005272 [Klebsiella pneumoniae]|nr:hypothetical protein [Klebsiella pneumoniae]